VIVDVHSHAWAYPEHFGETFRKQVRRARSDVEVDLKVNYADYRRQAPEEVRTIVFGGKAKLSDIWVPDRYVADYCAKHAGRLVHRPALEILGLE
jgi:hypothetical protein